MTAVHMVSGADSRAGDFGEDGYVKYCCRHDIAPAPDCAGLAQLDALRTELFDAGRKDTAWWRTGPLRRIA